MPLRNYQIDAVNEINTHWRNGVDKVLLFAPTGSGKTVIMAHIIAQETGRVVLVVRGRELVRNASTRLGLDHDIVMAGHKYGAARLSVCSVDTMRERNEYPEADLVVIDEAHMCSNDSYRNLSWMYPHARFLSVTATPFLTESLRHIADVIVSTCTMKELIHEGYLVPPRYFAPKVPDLSKVRVQGGEYNQEDIEKEVLKPAIIGSVMESLRICRLPGIIFTASIRHSREIVSNSRGDIEHLDAVSPDEVRRNAISNLVSGKIKAISNVGILTTGVDIPCLRTIIDAAPTLSLVRNIQKIGRGTRPFPGKEHFDVFDHAGNVHHHGFITDDYTPTIDGETTRPKGKALISTCKKCFAVYPATLNVCPHCHAEQPSPIGRKMKVVDGRLVPITEEDRRSPLENALIMARKLEYVAQRRGIKPAWIFYQVKRKYGDKIASQVCQRTRK